MLLSEKNTELWLALFGLCCPLILLRDVLGPFHNPTRCQLERDFCDCALGTLSFRPPSQDEPTVAMSTLRGAPAGAFELKRSSSGPGLQTVKEEYASDEDDRRTPISEAPQGEGEYEEEEEVDETVREDMNKLEDTFPGISDRFRLINRIGEGMLYFSTVDVP